MIGKNILIVGSGPVGLAAGLFLNKSNQKVTIIEKGTKKNIYSKALLTNTRTLNLLHTIGAEKKILDKGFSLKGVRLYFNN